jgi:ankyrin repeat protein
MDMSAGDEHRALHYAVLRRDAAMVRLLMEAGADARKGIFPHRDATSALVIARDRGYTEIVAVIEEEERLRREEMSCPNATISPLQEQINAAIANGDDETAIRLLEADRTLIQACDRSGGTLLHIAAEEANERMVAWLLERRANLRKEDVRGLMALDRAVLAADPCNDATKQFPRVAKLLLEAGSPLTIRGAVALGDTRRTRELLSADPPALRHTDREGGLLTLAVKHGKLELVRLLLDLGADVDERTMLEELEEPTLSWGKPLRNSALAGDLEITKLLLDRGADPNANVYASGWPLRNAWRHKDDSVKRLLLERGAKPQPYMVSEAHDVAEAKRLLDHDASEELAQELAWSAADNGCAAIVEMAVAKLRWAVNDNRWHWIIIQPIRGAGGDPASEGHFDGMRALLLQGDADRSRFAALLIDYGASHDVRDDLMKSTPLGWACR